MRKLCFAFGFVAATAAIAGAPAAACSPVQGYRVPTNLELAAQADAIVIGQVVGGTDSETTPGSITVHPLVAVKGLMPGQDFLLHHVTLATGRMAQFGEPSDPLELEKAHPEAYAGACIRRTFAQGATVLFFLDRADGEWVPAGGAFSRWAEDVSGEDAPWVQLARFYARVAPLAEDQRTALLEAEREALSARTDDPAAQAMAADLARTIAEPDPVLETPPDDGFRDPDETTSVQRTLDAMRAGN